jgi:hypothetical protein
MPIQTSWYDQNHNIVLYTVFDNWSITEFGDALNSAEKLDQNAIPQLHYIIDFTRINMVPSGLMARLSEIKNKMWSEGGMAVFVGVNPVLRVPLMMFSRLNNKVTIRYARTINEANSLIRQFQNNQ